MAFFLLSVFYIPSLFTLTHAARYVTCDACGYCPDIVNGDDPSCIEGTVNKAPGNWKACVKCLYPSLYPTGTIPEPTGCETVLVSEDTKMPPTPFVGRQYTMLGCLNARGDVFEDTRATGASSFVQALFDLIVFRITGGIAFLYLLYGSFLVLTSQADPERLNYGRRVIIGSVVGLIFALSSVFIVNLIGSKILRIPGFN